MDKAVFENAYCPYYQCSILYWTKL